MPCKIRYYVYGGNEITDVWTDRAETVEDAEAKLREVLEGRGEFVSAVVDVYDADRRHVESKAYTGPVTWDERGEVLRKRFFDLLVLSMVGPVSQSMLDKTSSSE